MILFLFSTLFSECLCTFDSLRNNIPGEPGVDFPTHWDPQQSPFTCEERVAGAYYVDPGLDCQAYHVCVPRRRGLTRLSFICPNGTIFNQEKFVCDWWFRTSCISSESQFLESEELFSGRGGKELKIDTKTKKFSPIKNGEKKLFTPNKITKNKGEK